ncbi:MAG: DUF983 domain-containing protein [Planctomycetota bacterium]
MDTPSSRPAHGASRLTAFARGGLLRCPACGDGPLFRGWFRMHEACRACGASFLREPGFYLGSIYINYGVTVIVTGALYALLVLVAGVSHETALAACLVVAVAFPVLFFRHARSFLLALDGSVNRHQQDPRGDAASTVPTGIGHDPDQLAALTADDGRAGCALGIALALILIFGLGMAAVTILFATNTGDAPRQHDEAVDLR